MKYDKTCSIMYPKDNAITFAKNEDYLRQLIGISKNICVYFPDELMASAYDTLARLGRNIHVRFVDGKLLDYEFFKVHNEIYKDTRRPKVQIGENCVLHETTVMNVDGIKFANAPDGSKLQFTHTGNLIIEDDVEIGPLCVIHRGTLDSTILKKGCKLASKINIGHNAIVGENTVIASGAILAGSHYGKNCWIGMGAIVTQGLFICDNVVIGAGAVVTKDITNPGIYVGNPAKFIKPITKGWNF